MFVKFTNEIRGNFFIISTSSRNLDLYMLLFISGLILTHSAKAQSNFGLNVNVNFETNSGLNYNFPQEINETKEISIEFLLHDIVLSRGESTNISYIISRLSKSTQENITQIEIEFNSSNSAVISDIPSVSIELKNLSLKKQLELKTKSNGYTLITVQVKPVNMTDTTKAYSRILVHNFASLDYLSDTIGWIYFLAWSISFYPQVWLNWKRKSVLGLHFDFLSLNIIGFLFYSIFNIGLYFIPEIQREYFLRHPYGVNPVQLNDVIFSVHAFFACAFQVIQCIIYERGDQQISRTGRSLIGSFIIMLIISLILGASSVIAWIDFLYFISYIKLIITIIKYIPQVSFSFII